MSKVLLVSANTERAPYPVSPLGLSVVATAAEERGHEVRVYDGMFMGGAALTGVLTEFEPDVVGISVRNIDDVVMDDCTRYVESTWREFVEPIRRWGKATLVLGGAGFGIFPGSLMVLWGAHFGVVGEGERVFPALLDALEGGGDPALIPGVVSRGGGSIEIAQPRIEGGALEVPRARIDTHVDYSPYRARGSYPIQTKRGCARRCVYCAYPAIEGRVYRTRTARDVVDEMVEVAARLGDIPFEFVDSTFNDPPGHAEAICREIIARGRSFRLRTMGVNPAGVTDDLIELMRAAGFAQIDCTPDSASPRMLASLRKGFTRAKLEEAADVIAARRMPTMWFFVLGGPGEDEATLEETFSFIDERIDPMDLVHLTEGLRIYPGTGLHEVALDEGVVEPGDDLLEPVFYISPMGVRRLNELVREFTATRHNCLRAAESTPEPEMVREALEMREREGLEDEPMFRTLLRIRKRRFE